MTARAFFVRWLAVMIALVFASATLFHDGPHAGEAHIPDAISATADLGINDCDRDGKHGNKGEHCAAVTVCKLCVPVAETLTPRLGSSVRHPWLGDSATALIDAPHRKPPKLAVRA